MRHKLCLVADTALITTRATSTAGDDTRPLSHRAGCNHARLHAFAGYSKGMYIHYYHAAQSALLSARHEYMYLYLANFHCLSLVSRLVRFRVIKSARVLLQTSMPTNRDFISIRDDLGTAFVDEDDFTESNIEDMESDLEIETPRTIDYWFGKMYLRYTVAEELLHDSIYREPLDVVDVGQFLRFSSCMDRESILTLFSPG